MTPPRPPSLNIHWEAALAQDFEGLRSFFAKKGVKLSKSKLGEIAIKQMVSKYNNKDQQLDFGSILDIL
jgi:hypothetical protein